MNVKGGLEGKTPFKIVGFLSINGYMDFIGSGGVYGWSEDFSFLGGKEFIFRKLHSFILREALEEFIPIIRFIFVRIATFILQYI